MNCTQSAHHPAKKGFTVADGLGVFSVADRFVCRLFAGHSAATVTVELITDKVEAAKEVLVGELAVERERRERDSMDGYEGGGGGVASCFGLDGGAVGRGKDFFYRKWHGSVESQG